MQRDEWRCSNAGKCPRCNYKRKLEGEASYCAQCRRERQRGQCTVRITPEVADHILDLADRRGYHDNRIGIVLSRLVEDGVL